MSAFVAVWHLDGRTVAEALVRGMLNTMPHRAPDGMHVETFGDVGLGHGMMITTPEAARERQPLRGSETTALTADLRIDNLEELRRQLGTGARSGDAENVLAAYQKWGVGAFDRLEGDFAFAVWDGSLDRLICARDVVGVKPIYYTHIAGRLFAVATEPKALLHLPEVSREIDPVRLADYLALMREDAVSTTYKSIKRLPPGHFMVVMRDGFVIKRFASLGPDPDVAKLTDEAAIERFRDVFFEAVRARMRTSHPLGSQLSGGLDSSAVTCIARAIREEQGNTDPIHTFSLIFDDKDADEREFINAVLDMGGFEPHFIQGDGIGAFDNLDTLCEFIDDNPPHGTQHLVWALLAEAIETGVRVVLDGIDGDAVVDHGQLRLKELAYEDAWETLAQEVEALRQRHKPVVQLHDFEARLGKPEVLVNQVAVPELRARAEKKDVSGVISAINEMSHHFGISRFTLWRDVQRRLLIPSPLRRVRRTWAESRTSPELPEVISAPFNAQFNYSDRYAALDNPFTYDSVRVYQRQLLASPRISNGLETMNHVAAANCVEVRHPFLDRRVINGANAMSSALSLQNGWTRFVLRRAIETVTPEKVTWRVGKALMATAFEKSVFDESGWTVLDQAFIVLGPLEPVINRAYLDTLLATGSGLSNERQGQLARIAILAYWLQRQVGQASEMEHSHDVALQTSQEAPGPVPRMAVPRA